MQCCCDENNAPTPSPADSVKAPTRSRLHWLAAPVQWAVPIATLVLIPKCPACVAAYALLFTGVGLSFSAASTIRWGLIALCLTAIALLLLRSARRVYRKVAAVHPPL